MNLNLELAYHDQNILVVLIYCMNNLNSNFLEDLDDLENSVVEENWGSEEIE